MRNHLPSTIKSDPDGGKSSRPPGDLALIFLQCGAIAGYDRGITVIDLDSYVVMPEHTKIVGLRTRLSKTLSFGQDIPVVVWVEELIGPQSVESVHVTTQQGSIFLVLEPDDLILDCFRIRSLVVCLLRHSRRNRNTRNQGKQS